MISVVHSTSHSKCPYPLTREQGLEPVFSKVLAETRASSQHIVVVLRDNLRSAFAPHFGLAERDIVEFDLRGRCRSGAAQPSCDSLQGEDRTGRQQH